MTDFTNGSQTSAHRGDYVWQYEYYDDEEPVSFEGLKAHRYSIVIGFWVGLAVFVIFMFFVLMLLTKTGAPHQDNPDSENAPRPANGTLDGLNADDDTEKAFSRPLLTESRSYFHFYIAQEHPPDKPKPEELTAAQTPQKPTDYVANGIQHILREPADDGEDHDLNLVLEDTDKTDRKCSFVSHFTIPNFVNLEHASALGDEDLLYTSSETLEKKGCAEEGRCDVR
uniref:Melanocortin-2 receptor accessory protein 2 n=1 Tax=Neogobius melanostomus TaxID=47308 RepID=A0A8C6U689_9GOBI